MLVPSIKILAAVGNVFHLMANQFWPARENSGPERLLTIGRKYMTMKLVVEASLAGSRVTVNRTRGFVNLNRFKPGRAVKRLIKGNQEKREKAKGRTAGSNINKVKLVFK